MTIGTNFVRGFNPIWYEVDLVGKQFDDRFYLWTLTNTIPYIPQAVFHDINGLIPWTDPVRFLANGTLPVDVFFDDTKVYRLEFRKNDGLSPPSQADALIYLVENYIPNGSNPLIPTGAGVITDNQITNPQFSLVNFNQPSTITGTNPPSIEVAPGWFLDLSGTGTVVLTQFALNTAPGNPTNAPYALNINSTGWTNPPVLRQRFAQNGMNWQNKTVATSITARIDGAPQNIIARMFASNGSPVGNVLINTPLTNTFTEYQGNSLIPTFVNLNIPPNAYIDYELILPQNGSTYVTSVQVTESQTATNVEYLQDTINRQIDHTFNYYQPKLAFKPIPSYLIGWNFPYNPIQFSANPLVDPVVGINKAYYSWDQTVHFRTADNSTAVSRGTTYGGYKVTISTAPSQFAIVQYLDQTTARKILNNDISAFIKLVGAIAAGNLNATISLWYTKDGALPQARAGTNQTFFTGLDANGLPNVFTGGFTWVQVKNILTQAGSFTLNGNSTVQSFGLPPFSIANGIPADANLATFFAIVVGFGSMAIADTLEIIDVCAVAGDIPTQSPATSSGQVQQQCDQFYWKTFASGIVPQQALGKQTGEIINQSFFAGAGSGVVIPTVYFPVPMNSLPTLTLYSPQGASAQVGNETKNSDLTGTATYFLTRTSFAVTATSTGTTAIGDIIGVHATADSRLGN